MLPPLTHICDRKSLRVVDPALRKVVAAKSQSQTKRLSPAGLNIVRSLSLKRGVRGLYIFVLNDPQYVT
jgi:DUF2075 family protein